MKVMFRIYIQDKLYIAEEKLLSLCPMTAGVMGHFPKAPIKCNHLCPNAKTAHSTFVY